jgi:hypothetical protein
MFDTVGGPVEAETWRRDALSTALLATMVTCGAVTVLALGGRYAPRPVIPDGDDGGEVFQPVFLPDPGPTEAPAPPGPARGPVAYEAARRGEPPPSDEAPDVPASLTDPPKPEIVSGAVVGEEDGDTDGPVGPVGIGVGEGGGGACADPPCGGCVGPDCAGTGTSPPVRITSEAAHVRSRVDPAYPREAHGLGLGDVVCAVDVTIDPTGRPHTLDVRGCPAPFVAETEAALWRWRWYPFKDDGGAVAATFRVRVVYREP